MLCARFGIVLATFWDPEHMSLIRNATQSVQPDERVSGDPAC